MKTIEDVINELANTLITKNNAYLLAQAEEIVRKQQASAAAAPTPASESK